MSLSNLSSSNSNGAFLDYGEFRSGVYIQTSNQILYFTDENGNKVGYQWKGLLPHTTTTNDPSTDGGISDTAWCSIVGSGFIEKLSKEGIDLSWKAHLPTVEVSYNLPHKSLKIWEEGTNSTDNDYWLYPGDGTVWNGIGVLGDIPDAPFKQIVPQNNVIEWSAIATEGQNQFTVPYEFTNISVFINGLLQNKSTGGYVVNGSTVTLNGSLKAGDDIHVVISNIPIKNINYITDVELSQPDAAQKIGLLHGGNIQNLQNFLSFDMFNIDKTGSTDVTSQINNIFSLANQLNIPIKQHDGTYLVSGSTIFTINTDCDLSGVTILPSSNFTGYFLYTQNEQPTTYNSSSSLVTLINSATINANDSILYGLINDTTLDGNAIFMKGNDPLYVARGTTKNWWCNTRISNRGKMDDYLKYGVSGINEVISLPISKKVTTIKLPNWDFINQPANNGVIRFNNISRYRIHGGSVFNRPLNDINKDPVIISINYAYDIILQDFYDEYPSWPLVGGSIAYAYTINFNYINRVTFKDINSQGYGWGIVGGQLATNITYLRCNINRVDMHDPFMGYLKILDCDLGYYGVSATGMGDMYIERTTFNIDDLAFNGWREVDGIINTRPDFGGWFDGGVYIKDITIIGDASKFREINNRGVSLFSAYSYNATLSYIPNGSPVEPWGFKEIIVNGLRCTKPITGKRFSSLVYAASVQNVDYFPRHVKFNNCDFNSSDVECIDLHGWKITPDNSSKTSISNTMNFKSTNFIEFTDCSFVGLEILRPYSSYDYMNLELKLNNCKYIGSNISPISFYTDQVGNYEFTNCDINFISDTTKSTSSLSNRQSSFVINGGQINSVSVPFSILYNSGYSTPVLVNNTIFKGSFSQSSVTSINLNVAEFAQLSNCRFYSNVNNSYISPALWLGSTSNSATSITVMRGNKINTVITNTTTVSGISIKTDIIPFGVASGHINGSFYVDATGTTGTYQLYLNSLNLKSQIGKIVSNGTISGIYLQ
ncbi:putative tail fiber protein [Klebsiella phage K64-1]|uniref:Depolymerase, capsule K64-specific n=1 Tax=Klebsiella phage K64-1 TaxID=1439894 RepID=DPO25_BPK64|nr:tail fiber protein [Klebsiella phage K64-1]A0A0A8JBR2.1 RecName: Full=Depolymerase, capsule K64-specific; AltName: Full=Probable tail fiber protein [Klebsiella phage K64-1]BAQ02780.1 tail fiber [Klebsiella phage K64-1]BAQ02842.1 putative tail fiber protein [Klebsiella phage K64-1]